VAADDAAALAGAIQHLVDDKELRERYGANAAKTARERFNVERMLDRVFAEYEGMVR
jgi:glycosyltransferase involved in cell wall biosynthesis